MKKHTSLAMAFAAVTALSMPAAAADSTADLARQIQNLQEQLRALQGQLEALRASEAATREAVARETEAREAAERAARQLNLELGGRNAIENGQVRMIPPSTPKVTESATHRFALSSPDNAWTIAPTGRLHFDMGAYLNQDPEGTTGPGTAAGGRLSSGVNARRARLGVSGRAMTDFTYALILDAGGATDGFATVNEARIGYTGMPNTIFEIGYGSQYFTLEEATSSNDIVFMERASPTTIASSFNSGDPRASVGMRKWGSKWWFGAYLTSSAPNVTHALTQRGFGAYQRLTYNIVQNDLQSVHIGVGAAQVFDPPNTGPNTAKSFTLSDRPELRIDPTPLLNTAPLGTVGNPVTSAQVYTAEAAAAFGGFFAQSEYFRYVVRRFARPSAAFDGLYFLASYTIGGRRTYNAASGAYSGVNPVTPFSPRDGGWGAFEFAARISYTDLVDDYSPDVLAAAQPFMVNGGRQTNITLGLNWFWNSNMLWKLNYIHSDFDKTNPVTATVLTPTPAGLKLDALAARFQVVF